MNSLTKPKTHTDFHKKMLISAAEYQRMGEAGIFVGKPRVELIDGEIYTMSPISSEHSGHIDKLAAFLTVSLLAKVIVRSQGSVRIDDFSEPEPDIAVLEYRDDYYVSALPTPQEIHLLIEVAVNSLETDRTVKHKKYATAGIPEYWIVIPEKGIVEVYRHPADGSYREKATYQKNDSWAFEAFELKVHGAEILI